MKNKRILSLCAAMTLVSGYALPISVNAAVPAASATALTLENGEETERTDIIKILFDTEIVFDDTDWESNVTIANGAEEANFGTGASAVIDPENQKEITITLGNGHTVEDNATITFANDIITDSANPEDVFNGDISVEGSFNPAVINYVIDPADAKVIVAGYTSCPTVLGIGEYTYTASYENYDAVSGTFEIKAEELNTTKNIEITLEKKPADYTELDAAILSAEMIDTALYTDESAEVLINAIEAAKNISRTLKFDEQSLIDSAKESINTAVENLAAWKTVSFLAAAVADDASVNYAKANKVYLVFAEPIEDNADILPQLSIRDDIVSAVWINDTVYELTLKDNSSLLNGAKVSYIKNNDIKTKTGYVLKDFSDVSIIGNLEPAADKVTANSMAATIVKGSAKPGTAADDKVVVIFNAPVKDSPESIGFITDSGISVTGNAVTGTDNTVYEITDVSNLSDTTTLTFGDIANIALTGSFGTAAAPKAMKAYAVDNDGTELVENDEIVVKFSIPTNGANDIKKVQVKGNGYTANLGSSTMAWDSTNTQLTIKLANDAVIKDGVEINLKNVGIKDQYEMINADETTLVLNVEGSFGFTAQPRITKAIAFSQGTYDYIRVFFNTEVIEKSGVTLDEPTFSNNFSMGSGADYGVVATGGLTYYEIKMDKKAHNALQSGTTISLTGIVDKYTGTKSVSDTPVGISGAFVSPIVPEVLNVAAISNDGSGVAKQGDKIVVIFNTEVSDGNVTLLNGKSFGSEYTKTSLGNVIEITLGSNPNIEIGSEIRFDGFKDSATLSATMNTDTKAVTGSFGKIIEPEILSATAISNDGSGIPKAGDKIVAVFNTKVVINGSELFVYEYVLKDTDDLNNYQIGKTFSVSVVSAATNLSKVCSKAIDGSYGLETMPSVKSATLLSNGSEEIINVIFDRKVNVGEALMNQTNFKENNKHLDAKSATWNNSYTVLTIALGSNATTRETYDKDNNVSGDFLNLSGLGIVAADTNREVENLDKIAIKGSLAASVTSAAIDNDGKTVVIRFSARTNGDLNSAQQAVKEMSVIFGKDASAEWRNNNTELLIHMGDDNTMSEDSYIVLNRFNIYDGFSKTNKVVGQYKVDTEKLDYKSIDINVYAQAVNTENTSREDVNQALAGDKIIIEFVRATNTPENMINNLLLENEEDSFGEGASADWDSYKRLVVTLGAEPKVTTDSKIIVKNVKFSNGTGMLSQDNADTSEPKAINGKFDGRAYWITSAIKNVLNGRTRITVELTKSTIATDAADVYAVCQAYDGNKTVESISAIGVPYKDKNTFVFDFNAANLANFEIFVLKGDYSNSEAPVVVYSETVEPTTPEE